MSFSAILSALLSELFAELVDLLIDLAETERELPPLGLDAPRFHLQHMRPEVDAGHAGDALGFEAAVVDLELEPGFPERLVALLGPRGAGLEEPVFRM